MLPKTSLLMPGSRTKQQQHHKSHSLSVVTRYKRDQEKSTRAKRAGFRWNPTENTPASGALSQSRGGGGFGGGGASQGRSVSLHKLPNQLHLFMFTFGLRLFQAQPVTLRQWRTRQEFSAVGLFFFSNKSTPMEKKKRRLSPILLPQISAIPVSVKRCTHQFTLQPRETC